VSASDMVYCITTILEQNPKSKLDQFWVAYDVLNGKKNSIKKIKEGIENAIESQKSIVQQVVAMIERKSIIGSAEFRIGTMTTSGEDSIFSTPNGISKLALFLMEFCKFKYTGKEKSLLICSENKDDKKTLLIGLSPFEDKK
jgi:hypothetical protein